ncbi:hypothetical protein AB8E32_09970 [Marinomonas polaris]|uniref:hypothetical protein n=1 Tax=Marinomonas polaris TaxID=293552 RepID=UPI0035129601
MSESNFTKSLGWTINFWDELGIWKDNEALLKKFLTLLTVPPSIQRQRSILHIIKLNYHSDFLLEMDEIEAILFIFKNIKYKKTTEVSFNIGVDYPVYFGVYDIYRRDKKAGSEYLSELISTFVSDCYTQLKTVDYYENDTKIYKLILAVREISRLKTIKKMSNIEKVSFLKKPSDFEISRYHSYINNTEYFREFSFWGGFNYLPESKKDEPNKPIELKIKKKSSKKKDQDQDIKSQDSDNYIPKIFLVKKKSWTTANKEIESVFDYSSLSLQSVVGFIAFVDEKKSELNSLLILCFLTGMTLKKALSAIRFSTNKKSLTVSISNTPTDSDLCSEIELKISPASLLHLDEPTLSIKKLVDKIANKFSYLTRQFSEFNGGNSLHFDRIASNSNRLLTPHVDDMRVHYLRAKIGFSMSAPFSYVALTNENIGDLYQKRFDVLSNHLEVPGLLSKLQWDSTLANQSLGSNRLPQSSIADFFRDISVIFESKKALFSLSRSNQLRVDLVNLIEINTYFLELLFFSNRPNGEKSISTFSDFFIRKDKNSVNYEEYKALPIPDLYLKQKEILSNVRFSLYKHLNFTDEDISKNDLIIIHILNNEVYDQIKSAPHRQILEILKTFNLEEIRPSNNTLRHFSGNALKFKAITSRALLGHNEDGFYYSSPASSSNIVSIHTDISEYYNTLIQEFSLQELTYDFD